MRILLFGDSITYGEFDSQGGWADRIKQHYFKLWQQDVDADYPLAYNLGFAGDMTKHLTERMPAEVLHRRSLWEGESEFTLVFAIGINDSNIWNGKETSSPERYGQELRALYAEAKKLTDKILFVGMTPVEDDHPAIKGKYINDRIWQFEQVQREFVQEVGVPFVPLFEVLKDKPLFVDGLHPNDAGHQLMYEHILPEVKKLVGA